MRHCLTSSSEHHRVHLDTSGRSFPFLTRPILLLTLYCRTFAHSQYKDAESDRVDGAGSVEGDAAQRVAVQQQAEGFHGRLAVTTRITIERRQELRSGRFCQRLLARKC